MKIINTILDSIFYLFLLIFAVLVMVVLTCTSIIWLPIAFIKFNNSYDETCADKEKDES